MLFFQYGVADVFPDDLGIDNSAASSIAFIMLVSLGPRLFQSCAGVVVLVVQQADR